MIGCALLIPSISGALAGSGNDPSSRCWRCAGNGGVNALYCYMRAHGASCEYAELLRPQAGESGPANTAGSLTRLAAAKGIPLQPVSLSIDELLSCPRPVIVHMDGESPEAGAFLLLFAQTDTVVYYVNGPTVTIHSMDWDSFRRVWSGIALVPVAYRRGDFMACLAGCSLGLFVAVAGVTKFLWVRTLRTDGD